MSKVKMNIWDREFNLDIFYKGYTGKEITENQKESYAKFIKAEDAIEKSKDKLVAYIEDNYEIDVRIDNIFKYVIPKMIFIPRTEGHRKCIILCDFIFDIEHGLAIVFENEKIDKIVSQDDVL